MSKIQVRQCHDHEAEHLVIACVFQHLKYIQSMDKLLSLRLLKEPGKIQNILFVNSGIMQLQLQMLLTH